MSAELRLKSARWQRACFSLWRLTGNKCQSRPHKLQYTTYEEQQYAQRIINVSWYASAYQVRGSTRWRSWLRHCATDRKVAGSIPDEVSESFRPHYGPGANSASNRNEYQGYLLGSKGGRCVGLTTLPPSCVSASCSPNCQYSNNFTKQFVTQPTDARR